MRYDDLVRRVTTYHSQQGQLVDFWLIRGGAIVASFRVRDVASPTWTDLLPTGASAEQYHRTIQRLAPIMFPGEDLTIRAIERGTDDVAITVVVAR